MPVVHVCRHLGDIMTSSATPKPDLLLRLLLPLRRYASNFQFCSCCSCADAAHSAACPAISKLVHASASVLLTAAQHQRLWDRADIQVWRALIKRTRPDDHIHAYSVFAAAGAPPPPLALAEARVAFLAQLTWESPPCLLLDITARL